MAKYRYLIERGDSQGYPYHLCTVDTEGESTGGLGDYPTVIAARDQAQEIAQDEGGNPVVLKWKDPPREWQPDAITVSQYLTPMYPDLPT